MGTFHAFCARVLREHGHALGLPQRFTICDASDQLSAVKSAMRELRVHETTMHPSAVLARISLAKNRMETPESFLDERRAAGRDQLVGSVWQRYREFLARTRALDFDDLLLETVRLLREHADVRAHYRKRYRHVLVDEYQDTNHPQYEIVREIGGEHRNVCVVGDDDQSIYGWRGADIRKILGFPRDFEGAKVVRLQTNYRSTRPILEAANAVIRHNASRHEKALESARGEGEAVRFVRLKDEMAEAQFVVEEMRKLAAPGRGPAAGLRHPLPHAGAVPALRGGAARERRCPTWWWAACRSSTARRCATSSRYLKLAVNPRDETSLLRIINTPPRGVGKASLDGSWLRHRPRHPRERGVRARRARSRGSPRSPSRATGRCARPSTASGLEAGRARPRRPRSAASSSAIDYRDEVHRLYPDPMTREARWAGVVEILNFAENHVRRVGRAVAPRLPRGAGAHERGRAGRRSPSKRATRSPS